MSSYSEFLKELARKRSRGLRVGNAPVSRFVRAKLAGEARENRIRGIQERGLGLKERALDIESGFASRKLSLLEDEIARQSKADTISGVVDVGTLLTNEKFQTGAKKLYGGVQKLLGNETTGGAAIGGGVALQSGSNFALPQGGTGLTTGALEQAVVGNVPASTSIGGQIGTGLTTAGAGIGGGILGGLVGRKLTKAGEPGHEGGEVLTGRAIGGTAGAAAGAAWAAGLGLGAFTGGISVAIGGILGAITGGGGSVICTELHRQGYLTDEEYVLDTKYQDYIDLYTYRGYREFADPIVKKMKKSERFTKLVYFIAKPVIKEMTSCVDVKRKGSYIGKILLKIGIPYFRWKGGKTEVNYGISW